MKLNNLPQKKLHCGLNTIDLSQPHIMGILNVTPDSFSDGGKYTHIENAIKKAQQMIAQGATIIDIGGESTRPGASIVHMKDELDRIIPIVRALAKLDVIISVDTSSPEVIQQAVAVGAHIWNDVRALTRPGALEMAAQLNIPVVLMHMRGEPTTMNQLAVYDDVVGEVAAELAQKIELALAAGISKDNILIDPGFGFAKDTTHNLTLLDQLWQLNDLGYPILAGLSRKRFVGELTACSQANERVIGSVIGHMFAIQQGVSIIRVHDVKETAQALAFYNGMCCTHQ